MHFFPCLQAFRKFLHAHNEDGIALRLPRLRRADCLTDHIVPVAVILRYKFLHAALCRIHTRENAPVPRWLRKIVGKMCARLKEELPLAAKKIEFRQRPVQIQLRIQIFKKNAPFFPIRMQLPDAVQCDRRRMRLIVMGQLRKDLPRRTRLLRRPRHDIALPVERGKCRTDECDEQPRKERIFEEFTAHFILKTPHMPLRFTYSIKIQFHYSRIHTNTKYRKDRVLPVLFLCDSVYCTLVKISLNLSSHAFLFFSTTCSLSSMILIWSFGRSPTGASTSSRTERR